MNFTYPKEEKLKSKNSIQKLFLEGKSLSKYPLRLVYYSEEKNQANNYKISVSVSKRYFKKAVDRNYFKRLLRESYRLNKMMLKNLDKSYNIMIFYQTKERLSFDEINKKMIQVFEKLVLTQKIIKNE